MYEWYTGILYSSILYTSTYIYFILYIHTVHTHKYNNLIRATKAKYQKSKVRNVLISTDII